MYKDRVKEDEPKANWTYRTELHTLPSLRKERSTSCISKSKRHYSMPNNFELCPACKIDGSTILKEQNLNQEHIEEKAEQSEVTHY